VEALVDAPGVDLMVRLPDPDWLSDRERLKAWRELRRARNRLDAAMCRLVGVIDRDCSFEVEDAPTVTSWLVGEGEPASAARSTVATARALEEIPATAGAFEAGDLDVPRVRMLVKARETALDLFARDEAVLVKAVGGLSAADSRRVVDYWVQAAAPEAAADAEERAHQRRCLFVSPTWAGTVRIDGVLDRASGAVVQTALETLTDPGNLDPSDTRTPTQRRADALTDLCRDYLDHGNTPVSGGRRPHLTLHVAAEALCGVPAEPCELDGAGVITPEGARRLACDAAVTRLTVDTDATVLDVGRATRSVPPSLRRALEVRDRGCVICGRPARWCDAHHIVHWADGGPTSLDNLVLLCRYHHHQIHQGHIQLPAPHTPPETPAPDTISRQRE
jgi:hypothetical protein